jgi:hypothetical protein
MCHASGRSLKILKDLMRRLKVDDCVLTQATHSTEADNISGGGSCGHTPLPPAGAQAVMVADGASASGLDIEPIMRSFDAAPQLAGAYSNPGALGGNSPVFDDDFYGTLQSFDMFPSFDTLFGLDM